MDWWCCSSFCAALLLALDSMWWREHAKSSLRAVRGPRRTKDEEEGCALCLDATASSSSSPPRSRAREADDEETAAARAIADELGLPIKVVGEGDVEIAVQVDVAERQLVAVQRLRGKPVRGLILDFRPKAAIGEVRPEVAWPRVTSREVRLEVGI